MKISTKKKPTRRHAMDIADIRVGKRHRRDLGDIAALAELIREAGLLHPIVIQPDGKLIAGARRLAACKKLGWTQIPVNVVDIDDIARGEMIENTARKDFTPSELVAITDAVAKRERELAKARQQKHGGTAPGKKHSGKLSTSDKGKTRDKLDKVAKPLGMSGKTLEKARAVVEAAAADPKSFTPLVEQMDKTGRVDKVFKQLKIARAKAQHAKRIEHGCRVDDLAALAESGKRFGVIMADPPWPWETWGGESGKIHTACDNHYDTQAITEIMNLPVAALAADDCALVLWCTWPHVTIGTHIPVIEAWGFKPSTVAFVWVKQNPSGNGLHTGNGYWTLANAEVCFIATKGSPLRLAADVHQVVMAPVGEHSEKPEAVRQRIERLFSGPYLELYARKLTPNWTCWGNEIQREQFREAAE